MNEEESRVEVNSEILKEIFKIAKINPPKNITDETLLDAIFKIKQPEIQESENVYNPTSNNILVIDDIGVVTYQLKILLRNLGYNVQVAKDIFSGLNTFVKSNYAFVVMDLFVSTEQEGLTLLNEIKKTTITYLIVVFFIRNYNFLESLGMAITSPAIPDFQAKPTATRLTDKK